jgi:SAM-dependent methyltransferase
VTGGDVPSAFKAFEARGWSERAGTYDALMARATGLAIEPLLDAAGVAAGERVLDVGCGLGALSAAATGRGAHVTGADLAEGMLAEARRRHPEIEFVSADAEALPFADGAFDVVLGAFLVNHLPDAEAAVAEMRRVAGRVALAAWGPQDEVAFLALPSRAAASLDPGIPHGPSGERYADRDTLAALVGGSVREVRTMLHVATLDELWDGIRGGTVRTAARLDAAPPEDLAHARDELTRLAEPYRAAAGYDLPLTILIARR